MDLEEYKKQVKLLKNMIENCRYELIVEIGEKERHYIIYNTEELQRILSENTGFTGVKMFKKGIK